MWYNEVFKSFNRSALAFLCHLHWCADVNLDAAAILIVAVVLFFLNDSFAVVFSVSFACTRASVDLNRWPAN